MLEIPRRAEDITRAGVDFTHRKLVHPWLTRGEAQKDRETAHERALTAMEWVQNHDNVMSAFKRFFPYRDQILETTVGDWDIPNPLGIAAGFDKNARAHHFLGEGLGFGLVTVGSVTKVRYDGNTRPRIFDLPNNDGLINRMGFPGDGTDAVEERLIDDLFDKGIAQSYILFLSIAASKPSFDAGTAIEDYFAAAKQMWRYGRAHEINVSSPNTPGVKGLQEPDVFRDLAQTLKPLYTFLDGTPRKPLFYKFSPDLPKEKLEEDIKTAIDNGATGISVTNTTTVRAIEDPETRELRELLGPDVHREEMGGISGAPLREKALEVSHQVFEMSGGKVQIKRAGGIQTAEDVWNALTYGGATVVETLTAFVRPNTSTPNFAHYILRDLASAMRAYDMKSMGDFKDLSGKRVPFPKI